MSESLLIEPVSFVRPPSLVREGDVAVLTHPHTGLGYRLNHTAAAMFESLREPITLGELRARFAAEAEEGAESAEAFVRRMRELGFVDVRDADDASAGMRRRYLDLLKKALVNLIYPEHELRLYHLEHTPTTGDRLADQRRLRDLRYVDAPTFDEIVACKRDGQNFRRLVTRYSHTMVGLRRLENLEWCASELFAAGVEGDFLEAGACQGGASIFMRALQVAYGEPHRRMWVADSFAGLPEPVSEPDAGIDFSESKQPWLAASLDAVRDNFRTYDLLSDEVQFIPGWFSETLAAAPVERLALLRIDADLYASTMDVLTALYDKVVPGGFVVVDDYHAFVVCRRAVDDFRASRGITAPLRRVDWTAVYWQKTA
ncbi:MAG: class I SAM-dependent methyltransferase [Acidobacteria bacterium]|nr:class I SAM-dependent methyltransferase [Acidobacteriota bacterium]MBV9477502.1 class I SAM-dependent methyltransferase [Acidobacteriota bacterium]